MDGRQRGLDRCLPNHRQTIEEPAMPRSSISNIQSMKAPNHLPTRDKIELYSKRDPGSGCWLWLRHLNANGYGTIRAVEGKGLAHRYSYRVFVGPIPPRMCVLHRCDTPACVNPDHLFLGTQLDNIRDRDEKNRQARGESLPKGKLTASDASAIKRRLSTKSYRGLQAELAKEYGVAPQSISSIHTGKSWSHL